MIASSSRARRGTRSRRDAWLAARLKPILRPLIRSSGSGATVCPGVHAERSRRTSRPAYLRSAVEGSLRRLRTDYLDLFQLHSPPLDVVERGAWEPELEALKRAGKIRYYGVACDTVDVGLAALRYPGVSSVQFTLNLLEQRALDALLPRAREKGVAFIARECLANGLLAKRAEDIDLEGVLRHSRGAEAPRGAARAVPARGDRGRRPARAGGARVRGGRRGRLGLAPRGAERGAAPRAARSHPAARRRARARLNARRGAPQSNEPSARAGRPSSDASMAVRRA